MTPTKKTPPTAAPTTIAPPVSPFSAVATSTPAEREEHEEKLKRIATDQAERAAQRRQLEANAQRLGADLRAAGTVAPPAIPRDLAEELIAELVRRGETFHSLDSEVRRRQAESGMAYTDPQFRPKGIDGTASATLERDRLDLMIGRILPQLEEIRRIFVAEKLTIQDNGVARVMALLRGAEHALPQLVREVAAAPSQRRNRAILMGAKP